MTWGVFSNVINKKCIPIIKNSLIIHIVEFEKTDTDGVQDAFSF